MAMSKTLFTLVVAALVAAGGSVAYARGGGGMGGGGMGGEMSGGGMSGGGMSGGHMSQEGMANTNGPDAADRDKGMDRAEDRRNSSAAEHGKATAKKKTHRKGGDATSEQR